MDRALDTNGMLALLEWYREAGVTHAVDETPTDWPARGDVAPGKGFAYPPRPDEAADVAVPARSLVEPTRTPSPASPPAMRTEPPARPAPAIAPRPSPPPAMPPRAFPTAPPDEATLAARAQARTARSLGDLQRLLETFDGCGLKATAKNLCFFRGAQQARLMVIGEAPGRDEDIAGKPFVGAAGQLLDRMLKAIGIDETGAHITNIVYWRPPGNRTPTPQEGQICRPFLERQIELVAPEIILLLGGAAAKHMLDAPEGIMKLRGSWRQVAVGDKRYRAMASLHPAYLLRTPVEKRKAWADLVLVKQALDGGER